MIISNHDICIYSIHSDPYDILKYMKVMHLPSGKLAVCY